MLVKPFIKWAGGKGQLLSEIKHRYPFSSGISMKKYCEPFVGGGAVFFDIVSNYVFEEVLINDINKELVVLYLQIKHKVDELIYELSILQDTYWSLNFDDRKFFYEEKRNRFNQLKLNLQIDLEMEMAVLFMFLNKTCFNGLYRVNSKGLFNVPIGSYKKPIICDAENLRSASCSLQKITITCGDYKECLPFIDVNTFVYIDPPYRPIKETSSFTEYAEKPFNDKEQIELSKFVNEIHQKGSKVIISNSDPKNTDQFDDFFDIIYSPYKIERVQAKRMINSKGAKRGTINELLISNF